MVSVRCSSLMSTARLRSTMGDSWASVWGAWGRGRVHQVLLAVPGR